MKLIDSYLYEVGQYLPARQRADILDELRSQLEDEVREMAKDSRPSRAEVETVLNRYGHPMRTASQYQEPRYLIGPDLYPAFVETLSTVFVMSLVIVLSLQLLAWVTAGWSTGPAGLASKVLVASLWLTGLTVVVFATLEYYGERIDWYDKWTASSLSSRPPMSVNNSDVMTNLITEGVFLLWWNHVLRFQNWMPDRGDGFKVTLAEVWASLFWPINILVGTWFVVHAFTLLRRRWTSVTLSLEVILGVLGLGLCIYLVFQASLVSVTGDVTGIKLIERSLRVTLLVVAAVIAWDVFVAWRRWRTRT